MSPPTARINSELVNLLFMWIETLRRKISCAGRDDEVTYVIARKLPSEYVDGHFCPPLLILILWLILATRAIKKATFITERGLLLTHFYRRCLALRCHHLFFPGDGIDHNRFPSAFRDSGADRIQVDALSGELVQTLGQRTRLVRQLQLLGGGFLVCELGFVQRFLGSPRILDYELHRAGRPLRGSEESENVYLGASQRASDLRNCTRSILNRNCELLGLGHVGSSYGLRVRIIRLSARGALPLRSTETISIGDRLGWGTPPLPPTPSLGLLELVV